MRTQIFPRAAALGIFVTTLISVCTMAQTTQTTQTTEEIVVQGSRSVTAKVVSVSSTGVPIQSVSLSYGVSTAGLDLASTAGAQQLEKRINDAALAACKEVGRQYPDSTPSDAECAKAAAKKAMVRAHEMIQAAGKSSTK